MNAAQPIRVDFIDGTPGAAHKLFASRKYGSDRRVAMALEFERRRRSGDSRRADPSSIAGTGRRKTIQAERENP